MTIITLTENGELSESHIMQIPPGFRKVDLKHLKRKKNESCVAKLPDDERKMREASNRALSVVEYMFILHR